MQSGLARRVGELPRSCDVLVAGSGAAGLCTALTAANHGATVTLLERSDLLGGTTAFSGGRVWVPNNHLQDSAPDDSEPAIAYLRAVFGDGHLEMIEAFVSSAPEMARAIEKYSPFRFLACPHYPD